MATPHIGADKGDFGQIVLMPGDPLRARFAAENFLEEVRMVTSVRNVFGFTGLYKGSRVSVMGSGMGMPSIGIYSYELFSEYDVEGIIRIGTAGAFSKDLKVGGLCAARDAWTDSSFARVQGGMDRHLIEASPELNAIIEAKAAAGGFPLTMTRVYSSDVFYKAKDSGADAAAIAAGCTCIEMESFALFYNAGILGKKAACLLTISDSFVTGESMSALERQTTTSDMIRVALDTAAAY